ncbi:GspH/FimT family pseudopilin [Pseudomonas sp. 1912-s]|uniref:GspH/FimT family pseudopilin n=1 Tax=Pseudomonas sp. 1912-s TaxID=3033802 RepID=UPI0023DE780A|nr:GspH/FimT family pseudopilin [Pseudomonas sp. 1912-s]MDF3202956.1 GspH/FimT family pseudopilin [Pseudomonas sp. 1912-s]
MPIWAVGNNSRQDGFTILELLAVLVIVSMAFTLLASGVSRGLSSVHERQSINDLFYALKQARAQAISEGYSTSVKFDSQTLCYRVDQKTPRCFERDIQLQIETAAGEINREGAMLFYSDGSSSGGNLSLKSSSREVLINVSWLTGSIQLSENMK